MEQCCFCWINNADMTINNQEFQKHYFQNPEVHYMDQPTDHQPRISSTKWESSCCGRSVSLPLQLSHILLQMTTGLDTLQTACCVIPPPSLLMLFLLLETLSSHSAQFTFPGSLLNLFSFSSSQPTPRPGLDQVPFSVLPWYPHLPPSQHFPQYRWIHLLAKT